MDFDQIMLVSLVVLGGLLLSILGKWMVDQWVLPRLVWQSERTQRE